MCDVLLIAPLHPDLTWLPDEVESVVNALHPRRILQGTVTEGNIYDALDSMAPVEGVWIGSHASASAIRLTTGEVPHEFLSVPLAMAGVKWVVLNMCESDAAAGYYTRAGIDVVAYTNGEVQDVDAWRMGRLLAKAVSENDGDLQAGYELVRDADPHYQFFPGSLATRGLAEEYATNREAIRRIEEKLQTLVVNSAVKESEQRSWSSRLLALTIIVAALVFVDAAVVFWIAWHIVEGSR